MRFFDVFYAVWATACLLGYVITLALSAHGAGLDLLVTMIGLPIACIIPAHAYMGLIKGKK